jgi:tripartite-type tricarboxylate transporter receptor subunit TctC
LKLLRRRFLQLVAASAAPSAFPRVASAQTYPNRPVRLLVGFPPGGVSDLYARLIAEWLSERLGQQFLVENRAGAGGSLATETVVNALPDGHTLLLAGANDSWNSSLYDRLSFNFVRDIRPVASISRGFGVLVVSPSFPAHTVPELLALAKANPGHITVASAGIGSAPHLFWELFKSMAGVDMLHVPYRGGASALTDLLGGQVQVMFPSLAPSIEYIRANKLRPLAITAATRSAILPEIPALAEYLPGYEAIGWIGVGAPKNTPVEIVDKLNEEINAGLVDPRMKARITEMGDTVFAGSPSHFGEFIVEYTGMWAKVIRSAKIKAD